MIASCSFSISISFCSCCDNVSFAYTMNRNFTIRIYCCNGFIVRTIRNCSVTICCCYISKIFVTIDFFNITSYVIKCYGLFCFRNNVYIFYACTSIIIPSIYCNMYTMAYNTIIFSRNHKYIVTICITIILASY